MKTLWYRLLTGVLLLVWLVVIFQFSAQPATESGAVSGSVSFHVVSAFNELFHMDRTEEELFVYAEEIEHTVRKLAHVTEYAVLGILSSACILGYKKWSGRVAAGVFLFAACYAATDEIHQLYVPGREGSPVDVCIDSLGILLGIGFFYLVLKFVESIAKKRAIK